VSRQVSPPRLHIRKNGYADLVSGLTGLQEEVRRAAAHSVNTVLTATYWEVGGGSWSLNREEQIGRLTARLR